MFEVSNYDNAQTAIVATLQAALVAGRASPHGPSLSIGSNRSTRELEHYQFSIANPRDRLTDLSGIFRLGRAWARLNWMAAASERLADIEPYDKGAARFSDDGVRIPGSNFGARIFSPRPDLNSVASAISLLRNDPNTRRATIPVFFPEDVGRESRDIPCVIALNLRLKDQRLHLTTLMRSNNALRLLPYNVFEFTLLQELIATELRVGLGVYTHYALSMHLYDDDAADAERVCSSGLPVVDTMPAMPSSPSPMAQLRLLNDIQSSLRDAALIDVEHLFERAAHNATFLDPYWRAALLEMLKLLALSRRDDSEEWRRVDDALTSRELR